MFGGWVQIAAPYMIGARDLLVQHWQRGIYEVRDWRLAAGALYLLCKLKAGKLFITELRNDFRNTDKDLIWFRDKMIYYIYIIWL